MKTVACYVRNSVPSKVERDESTIDTQLAETSQYARETLGCAIPALFIERDRTGTNLDRPEWVRLLADAEKRKLSDVVLTYRSRLGRADMATIAEYLLGRAGVTIHYIHEPHLSATGERGFIDRTVNTLASGLYVESIRKATTTKMEQMVREGKWTGGPTPIGYVAVPCTPGQDNPKRLIVDEPGAEIVRAAFAAFLREGRQSDALVTLRRLDPEKGWTLDAVKRLLTRRLYIGELSLGRAVNPSSHEPILTHADFEAVQGLLKNPTPQYVRSAGYQGRGEAEFPLRGLVRCGSCGCLLTPARATGGAGKIKYYECSVFRKAGKTHPCPVRRVNADHLLAYVLTEMERCASHPTRLAAILRASSKAGQYTQKGTEAGVRLKTLAKIEREKLGRIERLKRAIETADLPPLAIRETWSCIGELESDLIKLENEARALRAQKAAVMPAAPLVASLWGRVTSLWQDVAEEDRRSLLGSVVEEIVMDGPKTGKARMVVDALVEQIDQKNKTAGSCDSSQLPTVKFAFSAEVGATSSQIENAINASPLLQRATSATVNVDWSRGPCPKYP